jgi:inorganic pyrophosphatase
VAAQTPQPFFNHPLAQLGPRDEEGRLNVVIESPQGSRNKFKFDEQRGFFMLDGVLPAGAAFPYDFGFVPGTLGEDGDALDVLLLMDEPAFCGCVVPSRLIGVIVAEQTERDGATMRNDRLLAVAEKSHTNRDVTSIEALNETVIVEIEHFFASYNMVRGKEFKALQHSGPDIAEKLLREGEQRFKEQNA